MCDKCPELFADVVKQVYLDNGMVRMVFASLVPSEDGSLSHTLENRRTVVMPVSGFLNTYNALTDFLQKMSASSEA